MKSVEIIQTLKNCKKNFLDISKAEIHQEKDILFLIEGMANSLDFLIIQLIKRSESYEHIGKRFKFLADFLQNTDIDNIV